MQKKYRHCKHLPLLLVIIFIIWSAFWLFYNAATFSITSDEIVYTPAGLRMLSRGDIIMNSEHPPLNKILSGVFAWTTRPNIQKAINLTPDNDQWKFGDNVYFESGNNTNVLLFAGRLPTILLTLLMIVSVWLWTRKNLHPWTAVGAVAALALNPNILAYGALSTNDMHLTVASWFLFIASFNLLKNKTYKQFIWWGLALGFVMIAKFSGMFLVLLAIALVIAWLIFNKYPFKKLIIGGLIALVMLCATIWVSYVAIEYRTLFNKTEITIKVPKLGTKHTSNRLIKTTVVPFLRYYEGYGVVKGHNIIGHNAYLNGNYSMTGFRSFFLYALWYKSPTILLLLTLIGLVWAGIKKQWPIFLAGSAGILFVAFASFSHIHIGIRHILPFFVLTAPLVGFSFWQIIEAKKIALYTVLGLAFIWWITDLSLNSPNQISFFSEVSGGWKQGYKHMNDSNTDWGQELDILVSWAQSHPDNKFIIGYASGENPKYRGVTFTNLSDLGTNALCSGLKPNEVVIVSTNVATGLFGRYPCIYDKISKAERLGRTYLIIRPKDFN